jgi:deoxycytidylate deaminase
MRHVDYLKLAAQVATSSPDSSTQNGAILIPQEAYGDYIVGCNAPPPRVQLTPDRLERPLKYEIFEHAERRVIYEAALRGIKTQRATLYCLWLACPDCARAIICSGIETIIGCKYYLDRFHLHPSWQAPMITANTMLREAGITVIWIDEPLNVANLRFNYEVIRP